MCETRGTSSDAFYCGGGCAPVKMAQAEEERTTTGLQVECAFMQSSTNNQSWDDGPLVMICCLLHVKNLVYQDEQSAIKLCLLAPHASRRITAGVDPSRHSQWHQHSYSTAPRSVLFTGSQHGCWPCTAPPGAFVHWLRSCPDPSAMGAMVKCSTRRRRPCAAPQAPWAPWWSRWWRWSTWTPRRRPPCPAAS